MQNTINSAASHSVPAPGTLAQVSRTAGVRKGAENSRTVSGEQAGFGSMLRQQMRERQDTAQTAQPDSLEQTVRSAQAAAVQAAAIRQAMENRTAADTPGVSMVQAGHASAVQNVSAAQDASTAQNVSAAQTAGGADTRITVNFSKHALARAEARGIQVDAALLNRLAGSVEKAQEKGAKNILAFDTTQAFIINIPYSRVITAISQEELRENIFTNIDGAVLL